MRAIIFLLLLGISTMAFATKIESTLYKDIRFYTHPSMDTLKKYRLSEIPFPVRTYVAEVRIANPHFEKKDNGEEVNIKNSQVITIFSELRLVSYNKASDEYKFTLTLNPKIELEKTRNLGETLYKTFPAEVNFAKNHNNSILLSDKIIHNRSDTHSLDVSNSRNDFRLSVNPLNQVGMSTAHDTPITIELND